MIISSNCNLPQPSEIWRIPTLMDHLSFCVSFDTPSNSLESCLSHFSIVQNKQISIIINLNHYAFTANIICLLTKSFRMFGCWNWHTSVEWTVKGSSILLINFCLVLPFTIFPILFKIFHAIQQGSIRLCLFLFVPDTLYFGTH